jgi:hypothetical protein
MKYKEEKKDIDKEYFIISIKDVNKNKITFLPPICGRKEMNKLFTKTKFILLENLLNKPDTIIQVNLYNFTTICNFVNKIQLKDGNHHDNFNDEDDDKNDEDEDNKVLDLNNQQIILKYLDYHVNVYKNNMKIDKLHKIILFNILGYNNICLSYTKIDITNFYKGRSI